MTYVVAWKHRSNVFLVADSAATGRRDRKPSSERSSFGEAHVAGPNEVIEESAFKLFRWKSLGLACAGNVGPILSFIRQVEKRLLERFPPWAAIAVARAEVDVPHGQCFEAVAAVRFLGAPRLLRLDNGGQWHLSDNTPVHLGSPAPHLMQIVHTTISDARRANKSADIQLACVLASCQSLTVQQGLLQQGAGGAFSGLIFDRSGTRWQPDIAYLVMDPAEFSSTPGRPSAHDVALYVTCLIRDDILIVNSQARSAAVAFLSPLDVVDRERISAALKEVSAVRLNRTFDFVGLISTRWPLTAVIEMKKLPATHGLRLTYAKTGERPHALVVELNAQISSALRGERGEPHIPRIFFYSADPEAL